MADYSRERHGRPEERDMSGMGIKEYSDRVDLADMTETRAQTVGGQLTYLQNQISRTDETIKILEEHLGPILSPELDGDKSMGVGEDVSGLRTQSDIAETLESFGDRIARHNRRISRLLERVNL